MANNVGKELRAFTKKVLRATALDTQARMKRMTPVDTGALRANVLLEFDSDSDPKVARISNRLPYAQRIYLEGHSKQLPVGEFQAMVASIPQRMDAIARGLSQ